MKKIQHEFFGECVELADSRIKALIAPGMGMSLVDFSMEGIDLLDPGRKEPFLAFRKGLGPLILPHFGEGEFRPAIEESRFPHLPHLKAMGVKDPFQHGVGRYTAWSFQAGEDQVTGTIKGEDLLAGYPLKALEGFAFEARVSYFLDGEGLRIAFELSGEKPVAAGIHFYYDLVNRATAAVELPVEEAPGDKEALSLDFRKGHSAVFHPRRSQGWATYTLTTETYRLDTTVMVDGDQEETFDSVVLFSPEGERFACVEPLSYRKETGNGKRSFRGEILLSPNPPGLED